MRRSSGSRPRASYARSACKPCSFFSLSPSLQPFHIISSDGEGAAVVDRMKNNLLKVKGLFLALADISTTVNKQVCVSEEWSLLMRSAAGAGDSRLLGFSLSNEISCWSTSPAAAQPTLILSQASVTTMRGSSVWLLHVAGRSMS
eukprot:753883-Hanusia_phi.AAC.5